MSGASFSERVVYARGPDGGSHNIGCLSCRRAPCQDHRCDARAYRKKDEDNFKVDMRGLGQAHQLSVAGRNRTPIMTASSLWELVTINPPDDWATASSISSAMSYGFPLHLWLVRTGGYNLVSGTYNISYLGENGLRHEDNVPREDVLHFPIPSGCRTASGVSPRFSSH